MNINVGHHIYIDLSICYYIFIIVYINYLYHHKKVQFISLINITIFYNKVNFYISSSFLLI